jgi:hypothetical protein
MAGDGHIFPILLVLLRVYPHQDHTDDGKRETDEFNQGKLPFDILLQITNIISKVVCNVIEILSGPL